MKKLTAIALLAMTTMVGCTKVEVSENLEDFYLKSVVQQTEYMSLEDTKGALKNFEYEYELHEYSKEVTEEEKKEFEEDTGEPLEVSDLSFNRFSDGNRNIEIAFDETNKEVISSTYTKDEENVKTQIDKSNDVCRLTVSGDNIEYINQVVDKLGLSKNTSEVVKLYFEVVNNFKNNKDITIEEIIESLGTEHEKRKEEMFGDNYYIYQFGNLDQDSYIEVSVEDDVVVGLELNIGMSEYTNYFVLINTSNENSIINNKGFNIDMTISSTLYNQMFDKSQEEVKEAYMPINKALFEFAYKDSNLKFYTDEYDENKTDIIETRYNKEEEAYVITPNESRITDESVYAIEDKTVSMKLNKDEKANIEINTEKSIGESVSISLIDLETKEVVFEEKIEAKGENTIETKVVDKDGEYKLVFGIDNIEHYDIKVSAIKTN